MKKYLILPLALLLVGCASYTGFGPMGTYTVIGEGHTLVDAKNFAQSSLWGLKSSYIIENEWAIKNPWTPNDLYMYGITIRFQTLDLDPE